MIAHAFQWSYIRSFLTVQSPNIPIRFLALIYIIVFILIYTISSYHTQNSISLFVNIYFYGSVPFRKIPKPVWVSVLCGTKRNHFKKLKIFFITAVRKTNTFALNEIFGTGVKFNESRYNYQKIPLHCSIIILICFNDLNQLCTRKGNNLIFKKTHVNFKQT